MYTFRLSNYSCSTNKILFHEMIYIENGVIDILDDTSIKYDFLKRDSIGFKYESLSAKFK